MDSPSSTQILRTSALLFVDISGRTALAEAVGDQEAHARIDQRRRLLQGAATDHGGQAVKSVGDGLMCDFGDPDRALHAARAMQLTVHEAPGGFSLGIHSAATTVRCWTPPATSTATR